jgi:hypothetical protein
MSESSQGSGDAASDGRSAGPSRRDGLPRWRLIAAIALPLVAIAVVILLASIVSSRPLTTVGDPLPVSSVDAPDATGPACAALTAALPEQLGGLQRRQLVQGDDPQLAGVAAWGEPAVVLRCGLPTPQELTCSASIQQVDQVAWLPLAGSGATTYLAVDRSVRVALTIPDTETNTGPWQQMSQIIAATLPVRPICENGVPVPVTGD